MKTSKRYCLCSGNKDKISEFKTIFSRFNCSLAHIETPIDEVISDPVTVVVHKASRIPVGCFVDDTSLDLEDGSIGIEIKKLLGTLCDHIGKKASWTVMLGLRNQDSISIAKATILGEIVEPRGQNGFGFDRFFQPLSSNLTIAQSKPEQSNARFLAVKDLIHNHNIVKRDPIDDWRGEWQ